MTEIKQACEFDHWLPVVDADDYRALAARLAEADALLRVVTAHSLDLDADLLQRVSDHFRATYSASVCRAEKGL